MNYGMLLVIAAAISPIRSIPVRDDLVKIENPTSFVSGRRLVAEDYQPDFVVLRITETFRSDGSWRFSHNSVGPEVIDGSWAQNQRSEICVTYDAKSKCRAFYKSDKNPGYVFVEPWEGGQPDTRVRMRIDLPIN